MLFEEPYKQNQEAASEIIITFVKNRAGSR
jgi:hypothetical protein